jgi:hypothetical protein
MNQVDDWAREWNLVRADENMVRDVLTHPTETTLLLKFDGLTEKYTPLGNNIPRAFAKTELELRGTQVPDLQSIGLHALPRYATEHETHYINALDYFLIPYLEADRQKANGGDLVRLEGVIRIQCGWPKPGTRYAQLNPDPHFVDTDVRIYQFKDGVRDAEDSGGDSSTLLIIWAPDAPTQSANPDGSVLGLG